MIPGIGRHRRIVVAHWLIAAWLAAPAPAGALTIEEALVSAYRTNPALGAARAGQRATDEGIQQAKALRRPTLNALGGYFQTNQANGEAPNSGPFVGGEIKIPIYTAGRASAASSQASAQVSAGEARLEGVEQDVLLRAAVAYLDVIKAQQLLEAARANESALAQAVASAERRQAAGEMTATDVGEAKVQLAAARARRTVADGNLETGREIFREIVGAEPEGLIQPKLPANLPSGREEAVVGSATAPGVAAATRMAEAAEAGVDAARAGLRPRFDVQASLQTAQANFQAVLTVPLYDAGVSQSRARSARQQAQQSKLDLEAQRRNARQSAFSAWQAFTTSLANITAHEAQLEGAIAVRDSARREVAQGMRAQFQLLAAEQQVVNAQVSLINTRRDQLAAAYQLLAANGRLKAGDLGLSTEVYDPSVHAGETAGRLFDAGTLGDAFGLGRKAP